MKRNLFKRVLTGLLAVLMVFALVSCATKLNGTYTATDGIIQQSFTFDKDGNVKMSAFGVNVEGEYKIENKKITISYGILGISYDFVKSFEKSGKSIYIDGVEFVKE